MPSSHTSDLVTQGIRVHAAAQFLPGESKPTESSFVYGYRITLTNEGERPAQLISRHWVILDGEGRRRDVKGPGVVGQQPRLEPGQSYTYSSFSPLATTWGTMEGSYTFRAEDGATFEVAVGRFMLVPTAPPLDLAVSGT
ncbi:MAG: Co2+/Mg2+ efflux protein ApaG [Planctomycetota bacterium]